MKKFTLAVALILSLCTLAVYAQATAITIRTTVDGVNTDFALTARQVALMNRRHTDFNASRAASGQPTVTVGVFLRGLIVQALRGEEDQAEAHEQAESCAAYAALTNAKRQAILAELGGKSPCR